MSLFETRIVLFKIIFLQGSIKVAYGQCEAIMSVGIFWVKIFENGVSCFKYRGSSINAIFEIKKKMYKNLVGWFAEELNFEVNYYLKSMK